jgi:hypothetical protein
MTQRQSAWTQSAQLAFGVIADLCLEFTAIESIATRPRHETHAARQRSISIVTRANVTMPPTQKKQLEKPERRYAKTLQTTAWADLQQNELAGSGADTHHSMEAR